MAMSNNQWVEWAYQALFGRTPDQAGVSHWLNRLNQGVSREQVYGEIAGSREFVAGKSVDDQIRQLYQSTLGREARGTEIAYWRGQMETRDMGIIGVAKEIASSAEARNRLLTAAQPPKPVPDQEPEDDSLVELQRRSAKAIIDDTLRRYGLEELSAWAWGLIQTDASPAEIINQLYDPSTQGGAVFAQKFPEFEALRQAQNAGANVYVPSVEEVLELRRSYSEIMRQAGLPTEFWDEPTDFVGLIVNQRSPRELAHVVNEGWERVTNAPSEIREAFADLYGIDGDSALAALFLDPERAAPMLIQMARTAEVEGTATRFGAGLGLARAERVASLELSRREIEQGFQSLDNLASLFQETITESDDLTLEGIGVDAAFGLAGGAQRTLERRRAARLALLSGGGGAIETREGIIGAGTAN